MSRRLVSRTLVDEVVVVEGPLLLTILRVHFGIWKGRKEEKKRV